jgi:hypothetical protein
MTDDVPKQRAEGISLQTPTFSTEHAANFAKMRENAIKRNKALLKVRSEHSTGPYPGPDECDRHFRSYLFKIHINIILYLHLRLPNGLFLLHFPTTMLCPFRITPVRATYLAHLVFHDLLC